MITVCFVVRSVIGTVAAATEDAEAAQSLTFDIDWWFVLVFYGLCETLPTGKVQRFRYAKCDFLVLMLTLLQWHYSHSSGLGKTLLLFWRPGEGLVARTSPRVTC